MPGTQLVWAKSVNTGLALLYSCLKRFWSVMFNYPFRRTCKEVSALVVAREDRHLNRGEQLALRMHMLICKACPSFERQILTMRNAMRQWRNYADDFDTPPQGPAQQPVADKAAK
jgi:hypothetical protein